MNTKEKVFVYYNLHKHCWSVKSLKTGKIIARANYVLLEHCEMKVSAAGRHRVLREKRKNVHAGIVGTLLYAGDRPTRSIKAKSLTKAVSYNPYKGPTFFEVETLEPVRSSELALLKSRLVFI